MKTHENLAQGSPGWLKLREEYSTASEAPSIFNESKYKSRTALMEQKKGVKEVISAHTQKLFNQGHETEALARDLLEFEMAETFTPITATVEIEGLKLLASLDGLSDDKKIIFEHKLWNETLAENVRRGVLEATYYRQLDQQLLVTGADYVLFVVSDGTDEKREMMEYRSTSEKQEELILGWKQFNKDLANYEVEAKKEAVVAFQRKLPAITWDVTGTEIKTNLADCYIEISKLAEIEINKVLETDQDFADKESLNKEVKKVRSDLKEATLKVRDKFFSYSEFEDLSKSLDSVLQKMQSHGEKQVKKAKDDKKNAIEQAANKDGIKFIRECDEKIAPMSIIQIMNYPEPDYLGAMKGKRTIESLQNAVDSELARFKLEIDGVMETVLPNLKFLKETAKGHRFLFADAQSLVLTQSEAFQAIVKTRISDHEKAEELKREEERKKIKAEEEAKATKLANEKIEAAKEKIRLEERAKAEKEAEEKKFNVMEMEKESKPITEQYVREPVEIEPEMRVISEKLGEASQGSIKVEEIPLTEKTSSEPVYDDTELRLDFLNCLIATGVDNFNGYDEAVDLFHENYPNADVPR